MKIEELIAEYNTVTTEYKMKLKNAMHEAFTAFFNANPNVKSVTWSQYTPYFNDGDTCYFGVHDPSICIVNLDYEDMDGYEIDWYSQYTFDRDEELQDQSKRQLPRETGIAFLEFKKIFEKIPDEVMEAAFGDHVQVTATPKGFEVEEYEHD